MPLYAAQQTKSASERLEQVLREKDKENKRLKDSFDTLKHDNESLKRKVSSVCLYTTYNQTGEGAKVSA